MYTRIKFLVRFNGKKCDSTDFYAPMTSYFKEHLASVHLYSPNRLYCIIAH